MHVLVVATPKFPIPREELPGMLGAAIEWHERHKDQLESFGTFAGGGGYGVVNVADEQALNQLILEMPFSPYSHHEIRPFVPGVAGMQQAKGALEAMATHA